jgi:hypothetical protein
MHLVGRRVCSEHTRLLIMTHVKHTIPYLYRGAKKSLARPTSRCILSDGENFSFDASLVIYSTNIPPIMTINRIYEHQDLSAPLIYSRLPEDKPSGSKHVEDIKN